jgi:hypothetical protein
MRIKEKVAAASKRTPGTGVSPAQYEDCHAQQPVKTAA